MRVSAMRPPAMRYAMMRYATMPVPATRSPSAITSSAVRRRSGKGAREVVAVRDPLHELPDQGLAVHAGKVDGAARGRPAHEAPAMGCRASQRLGAVESPLAPDLAVEGGHDVARGPVHARYPARPSPESGAASTRYPYTKTSLPPSHPPKAISA